VKWGCQKLRGQRKMEIKYWIHECSASALTDSWGIWGGAVLTKTPIKMYITMKIPVVLNRVLKKFDISSPPPRGHGAYIVPRDAQRTPGDRDC
jgi:hypothetical protein